MYVYKVHRHTCRGTPNLIFKNKIKSKREFIHKKRLIFDLDDSTGKTELVQLGLKGEQKTDPVTS